MTLNEMMVNSITDFLTGAIELDDFVALSIMTDGLKASRDHIIGFCGVTSDDKKLFTALVNEGEPEATEEYHGIPIDRFRLEAVSPRDAYNILLDNLEGKYIVTHNGSFLKKFLDEFTSRNGFPPINLPIVDTSLLHKSTHTPDTIMPALAEDGDLRSLMITLGSMSYPRGGSCALKALYDMYDEPNKEFVNRLPEGEGNAFKIASLYKRQLATPLFGI